jgi:preprotein translocase subunit YajC
MMSSGKDGGMSSIIFLVLIFGVFWLFMIRPQMKKQKDQQKFKEKKTI